MKNFYFKFIVILLSGIFIVNSAFADNFSKAESLIRKAKTTTNVEEGYEYLHQAQNLYKEEYDKNQINIKALLGLSKTNQLLEDRAEAKLYVLKAYNLNPSDPKLQKEMGDFFYNFQEYSTAIEYYKLALASGLLRDYDTNLQTAKCYEKLGDLQNAELYYKICNHLNSKSKEVMNKLNSYESAKHEDNSQELENAKYKYLFKDKPVSENEKIQNETDELIEKINSL
jgi:lipopolysaccharide biosynthesis regulator YciM